MKRNTENLRIDDTYTGICDAAYSDDDDNDKEKNKKMSKMENCE